MPLRSIKYAACDETVSRPRPEPSFLLHLPLHAVFKPLRMPLKDPTTAERFSVVYMYVVLRGLQLAATLKYSH